MGKKPKWIDAQPEESKSQFGSWERFWHRPGDGLQTAETFNLDLNAAKVDRTETLRGIEMMEEYARTLLKQCAERRAALDAPS